MAKKVVSKRAGTKKVVSKASGKKQPLRASVAAARRPASAAKPAAAAAKQRRGAVARLPTPLYYRLNTFLHTLRVMAGYEDGLCTLLHALRPEGQPDPALLKDLSSLLEEIPSADYAAELGALRSDLRTQGGRPEPSRKLLPAARRSKK